MGPSFLCGTTETAYRSKCVAYSSFVVEEIDEAPRHHFVKFDPACCGGFVDLASEADLCLKHDLLYRWA